MEISVHQTFRVSINYDDDRLVIALKRDDLTKSEARQLAFAILTVLEDVHESH